MDNLDKENFFRRRGRIYISPELIERYPLEAMEIMRHILIAHAEFSVMEHRYHYYGFSERFDLITSGQIPPVYKAERIGTELVFTRLP